MMKADRWAHLFMARLVIVTTKEGVGKELNTNEKCIEWYTLMLFSSGASEFIFMLVYSGKLGN